MTILGIYLINQIRTGGDRDYLELLEALAARGNRVFVLLNSYLNYTPAHFTPIIVPVKYKRHHLPPASFLFKKKIKQNIKLIKSHFNGSNNENYIIHIHGDIYLKSALWLKQILNIPLFYASRNNDIDRDKIFRKLKVFSGREYIFSLLYEQINRFREKQIARHAALITFLNASERDAFIKRTKCDINKISIIPNSTTLSHFNSNYKNSNTSSEVKTILYVGALSFNKGFWDLLKAASFLRKKNADLQYFALGRLENIDKTLKLIERLRIADIVRLEGYQDPFPYFKSCDLFVYPTPYEAFGNVITESLYSGCPVIASAVGGIPEILKFPELLFNYGDIPELCGKIEKCIKDTSYYQRVRSLCGERIAEFNFDWAERFEKTMINYD
jgi:glycosyltransferase involved in cell wall biosynthesis